MAADSPEFIDPAEDCPWCSRREIVGRFGYEPLPPSELDDRQLPGRLWELLYAAAARRFFLCSTNHLNDRELYALLWEQWLDEPTADIPLEAETTTTTIIAEFNAGGMTHEEVFLRYYADESDQELWHSTDPEFILPPRQDPPYDRDRFLPVPPIPLQAHAAGCRATTTRRKAMNPIRSAWPRLMTKSPPPKPSQFPVLRLPTSPIPRSRPSSAQWSRRTGRRPRNNSSNKTSHCCRRPKSPMKR